MAPTRGRSRSQGESAFEDILDHSSRPVDKLGSGSSRSPNVWDEGNLYLKGPHVN